MGTGPAFVLGMCVALPLMSVRAETLPARGEVDSRIRVAAYNGDEVYRLHGYVGYQIDLQFEPGETFVGLGSGDLEGLSFVAQDNHLFLKPKVARIGTNLTVLTNRRHYQFDYASSDELPDPAARDLIYALRFTYPPTAAPGAEVAGNIEKQLGNTADLRSRNVDYWYCGHAALKPVAASDDGVHTRLRFGAHAELPALFVRNDDGTESLLNFSMDSGDVIVHRVARRLIVRRGNITGCIVNKGFTGGGERLDSGTVAPSVERGTRGGRP
jgi:type IV secretion system protein VirB9